MIKKAGIVAAMIGLAAMVPQPAQAVELKDMVGKWKWTDYTVEVKECATNPSGAGICATVIDGPKYKGMEMIRSKLEKKGADFHGKVAHPATQDIYTTKLTMKSSDVWSLDGCTDKGVCAKGDFVRIK